MLHLWPVERAHALVSVYLERPGEEIRIKGLLCGAGERETVDSAAVGSTRREPVFWLLGSQVLHFGTYFTFHV